MATEILVPALGESVVEATVVKWFKRVGDAVALDEPLAELETEKVTVEVPAPTAGVLASIAANEGDDVEVGALLCAIDEAGSARGGDLDAGPGSSAAASAAKSGNGEAAAPAAAETVAPAATPADVVAPAAIGALAPAVRRLVEEHNLDPAAIPATGKGGRLTKADVLNFMKVAAAPKPAPAPAAAARQSSAAVELAPRVEREDEQRVRMTRLRRKIAQRLKEAQNTAAMLTTFNEVDMTNVMDLRSDFKQAFEKKHGVRLGFMSFFIKAAVEALKEIPAVNAEIYGDSLIYKNYYDIGVAVGTPQGLVVPVLRGADAMSFAEIEGTIVDLAKRARDGKLTMAELTGGTFTITNGGVFGSLLSTPILNPPQSGILGMHKTQKRPVAVADKVEVRAMMYLALSYDHRVIDGREAVTFLVRVKECIEDPQRMLLSV